MRGCSIVPRINSPSWISWNTPADNFVDSTRIARTIDWRVCNVGRYLANYKLVACIVSSSASAFTYIYISDCLFVRIPNCCVDNYQWLIVFFNPSFSHCSYNSIINLLFSSESIIKLLRIPVIWLFWHVLCHLVYECIRNRVRLAKNRFKNIFCD